MLKKSRCPFLLLHLPLHPYVHPLRASASPLFGRSDRYDFLRQRFESSSPMLMCWLIFKLVSLRGLLIGVSAVGIRVREVDWHGK